MKPRALTQVCIATKKYKIVFYNTEFAHNSLPLFFYFIYFFFCLHHLASSQRVTSGLRHFAMPLKDRRKEKNQTQKRLSIGWPYWKII